MKQRLLTGFIVLGMISSTFYGCKKEKHDADDLDSQTIAARDEADMQSGSEQALSDINTVMDQSGFAQRGAKVFGLCGGKVDTSQKAQGKLSITYDDSTVCRNKKRSGSILLEITPGQKWRDEGATIRATFNAFKVTRISDGKSITLNGTKSITNVYGGLLKDQIAGDIILHRIRGNLNITFDNGTMRSWTVARRETFTLEGTVRQVKLEGDTSLSEGGVTYNNVVVFGTNRLGKAFKAAITTPIIANSTCEFTDPIQGVKVHKGLERELTITFGVDSKGTPVTSGCAYGFKVDWDNARGQHRTVIAEYR